MRLDGGDQDVRSGMGTCCSIFLIIATIFQISQKLETFVDKSDVKITLSTQELHFTDDDKFSYQDGFNIAAALTAYDNNEEWVLDPKYGDLVIKVFTWGEENGETFSRREALNNHNCTRENLGLEGDSKKANFFPPHRSSRAYVE